MTSASNAALPRVLLVDDEPDHLASLEGALQRDYELYCATSGRQALELLSQHEFRAIISGQRIPDMTGVELLREALTIAPHTARIILTGCADLDCAIDAINLSQVSAFIRKPVTPAELAHAVQNALDFYDLSRDNGQLVRRLEQRNRELENQERLLALSLDEKTLELQELTKHLEQLSVRDGLTGLFNHRYFHERCEQEVERAKRYNLKLSLVFFDIDNFRSYNDTMGHPAGDRALVEIGRILRNRSRVGDVVSYVREIDIVARYGGEEFVVLLPETPKEGASVMAERLRAMVEAKPFVGEEALTVGRLTISAGVAAFPDDANSRSGLVLRANEALSRAKRLGSNRVCSCTI